MNIAVDYGNTTAKVGIFEKDELLEKHLFSEPALLYAFLEKHPAENVIVSSVSESADAVLSRARVTGKKVSLATTLSLPVILLYTTPQTLGVDRIAAVCGALDLFPGHPKLIIDAGTCITYEFLDEKGSYHGGGISPGVAMRFESMHHFTSRLPLVSATLEVPLIGNSTESCMQSGVINGVRAEVEGMIQHYLVRYPDLQVILCGGDTLFFESHLKASIFVAPNLVLQGLNRILQYQTGLL